MPLSQKYIENRIDSFIDHAAPDDDVTNAYMLGYLAAIIGDYVVGDLLKGYPKEQVRFLNHFFPEPRVDEQV